MGEAARVGDPIGHSHALAGMIAGTVVGGLLAAAGSYAAGALFAAGLATSCLGVGLVVIGISVAVGFLSGWLATTARDALAGVGESSFSRCGTLLTGSHNVFINGKPAALATFSRAACSQDGPCMQVAQGASNVFVNGFPLARSGDKTNCGATILSGSPNVIIGGGTVTTLPIKPEVPEWVGQVSDLTLLFAGLLNFSGGLRKVGAVMKLAEKLSKLRGVRKTGRVLCRLGVLMTANAAAGIILRPVDIITGQKFLSGDDELDFVLPARLPLTWQRTWHSANPTEGVLGHGWSLESESHIARYENGVAWYTPTGEYVAFPLPPVGCKTWSEAEKCWLMQHADGSLEIFDTGETRYHYAPLPEHGVARLTRISDIAGNATLFYYDARGLLSEAVDGAGQFIRCHYHTGDSGATRLSRVVLLRPGEPDLPLVRYDYDPQDRLIRVQNRAGETVRRFGWDDDGLMAWHEDASGLRSDYAWQDIDGLPRVTGYRGSDGEWATLGYDFEGGRRSVQRDGGQNARWVLDDDEQVAQLWDYDGRRYTLTWARGEPVSVRLPSGAAWHSEWDRYGRLLKETDPDGHATEYQYSRNSGQLFGVKRPDGSQHLQHWDTLGRLTRRTDARGNHTDYHYDDEEESLPARITDALGGEALLTWNRQGQLTQYTDCSGSITRYDYDALGQLTAVTDAEGSTRQYRYDSAGRLAQLLHPDGSDEQFAWRPDGQLSRHTDPGGSVTLREYGEYGQLRAITGRNGITQRFGYGVRGRLEWLENGNGERHRFAYDPLGRRLAEQRPDGLTLHWGLDEDGWPAWRKETGIMLNVTPPRTLAEAFRALEQNPPGSAVDGENADGTAVPGTDGGPYPSDAVFERLQRQPESHQGDGSQHRAPATPRADGPARQQQMRYSPAGRLLERSTSQAQWQHDYDSCGRLVRLTRTPTALGLAAGITADVVSLRYDADDNPLAETGGHGEVQYAWDALDNLTQLTLPQGDTLRWLHYGSGHVSAVKFNQKTVSEFTRDRMHRELSRTQGALTQHRAWDVMGRRSWQASDVAGETDPAPESARYWRTFRYSLRGEISGNDDAWRGSTRYQYDTAGRMTSVIPHPHTRPQTHLRYDGADNLLDETPVRLSSKDDAPLHHVTGNRLRHWQRLFNRYDPWGNLISRRCGWLEQHYEYDDDNRLIRARGTGPQGRYQAEYRYDALGRRSSKTVTREQCAPETTRFVWQGWRLLQEQFAPHAGYGDRCRTWCYDPDSPWTPLAALGHTGGYPSVQIQYLHCDLNSAPLECTDEQGQLRWSGDYAPFGEVTNPVINSMPMLKNQVHIPLRYAGQYEDRETGLHYNLFRYYDPQVGRFTTPDPIGVLGGFNLYQYAPNPNGWVDPLGLAKVVCSGTPKDAQKKVTKGQGPKDIKRIDEPEQSVPGSQWHAHQTKPEKGKNPALNQDGSTHDGPPSFTKKTLKWLQEHGWNVEDWL